MPRQIVVDPERCVTGHAAEAGMLEVASDLALKRLAIVNVILYGPPKSRDWVLVDAGVVGTSGLIEGAVDARFGDGARPRAIVLTHGHFDHVGTLEKLARRWNVPIYAHRDEHPFLDGTRAYPPPDPTVGGLMAALSPLYPRASVDVSRWLRELPEDEPGSGPIPDMPEWRWIHTPGHAPGHVSLWRETDRTLIAGDAFITTAQEDAYAVARQEPELHGPPAYFTTDWPMAERSVRRLGELRPELVLTGHGPPMAGATMRDALERLARGFRAIAVPPRGRYVDPAYRVARSP